jgi:hypothetical protein
MDKWKDMTRTGHLNKYDAWTALNTCIMKMIKYPLPALTLNKKQYKYFMSPIMSGSLNSIGVVCTFPHVVAYAPLKYQGITVKDSYMTMGIAHIKMPMEEFPRESQRGKKLQLSLEAMKVEVGLGSSIFPQSYWKYGFLATKCLVAHTWGFLEKFSTRIKEQVGDLKLQQEWDNFLTKIFQSHGIKREHCNR